MHVGGAVVLAGFKHTQSMYIHVARSRESDTDTSKETERKN